MCSRSEKGFHTACKIAGIEALIWKDLQATFGTRLLKPAAMRSRSRSFSDTQMFGYDALRDGG
jgi:hypothetical protein